METISRLQPGIGRFVAAAFVAAASSLVMISPADAKRVNRGSSGSITACSNYGNGCYSAPVRQGRFGLEARLKGGTWIDCRGDCQQAIREEYLDFWETQEDRARAIF